MDHIFNRTFTADRTSLSWVPEGVCANMSTLVTVELTGLHLTQKPEMVYFLYPKMVSSSWSASSLTPRLT